MSEYRIIYADGVVATGEDDSDMILSVRKTDAVAKGDFALSAFKQKWGHWYPTAFRDIRLFYQVDGQTHLEGESNYEPVYLAAARRIARRRKKLSGGLGIAFFHLSSAEVHLRSLLREYVKLTTVVGPEITFDTSPVVSLSMPECYCAFDAFMTSLKSFSDSLRFIIWGILEPKTSIPRSLNNLVKTPLPSELHAIIDRYVSTHLAEVAGYRDNSVHYAPPGTHMAPYLLHSHDVIHAQVWLPHNPEARSLKQFKYQQKDAFSYARSLLETVNDFNNVLFTVLDAIHRERMGKKRKTNAARANKAVHRIAEKSGSR